MVAFPALGQSVVAAAITAAVFSCAGIACAYHHKRTGFTLYGAMAMSGFFRGAGYAIRAASAANRCEISSSTLDYTILHGASRYNLPLVAQSAAAVKMG